jgi:hypothetical protein
VGAAAPDGSGVRAKSRFLRYVVSRSVASRPDAGDVGPAGFDAARLDRGAMISSQAVARLLGKRLDRSVGPLIS